jgi:hypothetical protein
MQSSGVEPFLTIKIRSSFNDTAERPLHVLGFVPSTIGVTLKKVKNSITISNPNSKLEPRRSNAH